MRIRFDPTETIIFASSSGHCNLDCQYCVASPVVKHQPSLTYEDLMFLKESVGGRVYFIFSGRGDFFAGYRKSDLLLARLLDHKDIRVALDINGVAINCFPDLSTDQLSRVQHINLTFHYRQLKQHRALNIWLQNALTMLRMHDGGDFFINFILTPKESTEWDEALSWYETNLFGQYPKKIVLINDVLTGFTSAEENILNTIQAKYQHLLHQIRRGSFETLLSSFSSVQCPAGQSYFRVWNDGSIQSCPNISELHDAGNAKSRIFKPRSHPYTCTDVRHCDCYHIASSGRMIYFKDRDHEPLSVSTKKVIKLNVA